METVGRLAATSAVSAISITTIVTQTISAALVRPQPPALRTALSMLHTANGLCVKRFFTHI